MSEFVETSFEGFVVDTDAKAEWALGKIREARAERDKWVDWYKAKINEVKEQTDFETMNLERMLSEYFANVPHKKTKTQESYKLPTGKLVMKTQNPEYKIEEETVIEWAKKNGLNKYVKVEEKLAWADLKAATGTFEDHVVTEDGEIIPGITVEPREPKFVVEV